MPQDLEFAIEGDKVYLTQSRPITTLKEKRRSTQGRGCSVSECARTRAGCQSGRAHGGGPRARIASKRRGDAAGEILVTHMTSPDWVPIMRRAAAIVTDAGGMTSHAAIVARELGLPCVVGAHDATKKLATGSVVTVDGSAGTVAPEARGSGNCRAAAHGRSRRRDPRRSPPHASTSISPNQNARLKSRHATWTESDCCAPSS